MRSISLSVLVTCIFLLSTGVFANLYNSEFGNHRNYYQIPRYRDILTAPFPKFGIGLCPTYCQHAFHTRTIYDFCASACGPRYVLY
jgi:hypothetical protein